MIIGNTIRCALLLAVATLTILGAGPRRSQAQAEDWIIVPIVTSDDATWAEPTVAKLSHDLARQGIAVWSGADAASRFEANGSAPAPELTDHGVAKWIEHSQVAIGHLARTDYSAALKELEPAQELSRNAVEELNREEARTEILLDICLYTVRALLGTGNRAKAKAQAEECARLSPAAPNTVMHPPDVRAFYADVVGASEERRGTLRVESDPPQCEVRLNGVAVGRTPLQIDGLLVGPYGAQVECEGEGRGRVHPVSVVHGNTELYVSVRFDAALRTDRVLRLRYSQLLGPEQRVADARAVAQVLPADVVVVATVPKQGTLELEAIDAIGERVAFARIPTAKRGPGRPAVVRGVAALVEGRCEDFMASEPQTVDCGTGQVQEIAEASPTTAIGDRPPRGQFIAGVTLASVGTASLVTAYALYGVSSGTAAGNMIADPSNENQSRWLNLRSATFYMGGVGAASLVTAMPLVLPYRAKPPWWAWLSGGVGVALAATSIALAVTAPPEPDVSRVADPQGYVDRADRTDAAVLAGVTAAPLLTIPLVYLLRREDKRPKAAISPGVAAGRAGGVVSLRGEF